MDYGHVLKFGTFITPVNDPPQFAVERARLSEELGFDLVTFQDHPYQPGFLDTWTLMSWVAAQTGTVHIAANVLNTPMRPAAVTARAAASLDLLSGGRFDLALGAGAFWDAMAAMGARRLTPAQAVDALGEAIDVIRAIWAADERSPLRFEGEHYQLNGAKRGPAPAHDMPIWLGALKPRMLRLIGAKADGWLPSLAYLKPGQLQAGQKIIDEAALEAGRDPREISRLLNITGRFSPTRNGFLDGPSEQWSEELLPLILADGVATLILASDDPRTLRQFAEEVAPSLREAVAAERATTQPSAPPAGRSAVIRARRRPGIDYDGVPAALTHTSIEPGDAGYARVRSTYLRGGSPGLVIQVPNAEAVGEALAFARSQPVPLSIRSGGHGISGRSTNDGGIVIDLSRLTAIEVLDASTRRVRIEPGARWSEVAAELSPHGWALTSGDYGGVGVGGLATSGGIGWLVRERGLTIDHLLAVDLVLADGSQVRADREQNPDLFWAIRGAGANFGIVTAFEFEVDEVADVGFGQFVLEAGDTADLLERWGAMVEAAPRDLTSNLIMGGARPGQPLVAQVYAVVSSDDPATVVARLQPLAELAPLLDHAAQIVPYAEIMKVPRGLHAGQGDPVARSGLIEHISPEFAAAAANMISGGDVFFFQIRSVGGAVADVDPADTAYPHRSANFSVTALGVDRERVDLAWDEVYPYFTGLYANFETDLRPQRLVDAFGSQTLSRLQELKARYDPDNVFRDNFNISPRLSD
jgi:alkanesulfonate monooxygenase SsuD/methylene tetrahydromethanopterin reductase-like flavin-dependent oxidoreductase (luciferase family)/FAD/FMN-containing dehydrogenase